MEADIIGMDLAARACFDPAAGKRVFTRLGDLEKKMGADKMPSILRTHPVRCLGVQGWNTRCGQSSAPGHVCAASQGYLKLGMIPVPCTPAPTPFVGQEPHRRGLIAGRKSAEALPVLRLWVGCCLDRRSLSLVPILMFCTVPRSRLFPAWSRIRPPGLVNIPAPDSPHTVFCE